MVLLLIGLSVTIKPIVTRTFDPTKFDLYIGIENYAKIISKKLKTSETIAIVFRIRIDPLVDLKKLEKLFVDLPKFYNALLENIGDRLRLIIEVDSNKLLKIQNNLINNEIYSLN